MVLQFQPPPDWLVQGAMNRPNPVVEALGGVNQVLQQYAQQRQAEHKSKNEALQTLLKASDSVDLSDPNTAKAFAPLYKDAGVDPTIFNPSTPPAVSSGTMPSPQSQTPPVTAGMPNSQGVPAQTAAPQINPLIQASLNHPDHQAGFTQDYIEKMSKTGYGRKVIASQEAGQKLADAQATAGEKAEENGPKQFGYARAFSKSAGAPDAAEPFIQLAQSEGRNALNKREMDDIKNSINASAQRGRGRFYDTQAELNTAKFNNQLLQQGNKAVNPNVASGALKQQQERLNRIGRAEALVQQMGSQLGGGDTRQVRELATSLASVLTGGNVVAQQQVEELIPQTYKGNMNRFLEKLTNNPTGLEQQEFIKRFADTLQREKGTIHTQIKSAQEAALPGQDILRQRNPQGYQAILDANMNAPQSQPTPGMVTIRDSQGGMHTLPSSNLEAAKQRDPGLQVVQ